MARIGRSREPLYVTQGEPFSFPVRIENPSGSSTDLTGSTIAAEIKWAGVRRELSIEFRDISTGKFRIYGGGEVSESIPLGRFSEIVITHTDAAGTIFRYVYPVIGEVP